MPSFHKIAATIFHKHMIWLAASGVLLGLLSLSWRELTKFSAQQIASPKRKPLQDYHAAVLQNPATRGLALKQFTTRHGTPVLIATSTGQPSEKGISLRQQLLAQKIAVPSPDDCAATIVLLHARNSRKEDLLPIAERFCACGFRCIMPDLPAHGDNPERTTTYGLREASLPSAILQEASEVDHFEPKPAFIFGISMGASFAIHSASEPNAPWTALSAVACFDTLANAVQRHRLPCLGTSLPPCGLNAIDGHYYQATTTHLADTAPSQRIRNLQIPTQLVQGENDHVAPLPSGRMLQQNLPKSTENELIVVPGASHSTILTTDFPAYQKIITWFIKHLPPQASAE